MGKTKVVLDTNTIVSAFGWEGNPRKILRMILDCEVSLLVSPPQLDELRKVIEYPRLGFDRRDRERVLEIIVGVSTLVQPKRRIDAVVEDPADNMVLACAVEAGADYIISGDRHLLKLGRYGKTRIVNSAEFLKKRQ